MDALGETDEFEVFDCKSIMDLISFKWQGYAGKIHYIGLIAHLIYLINFSIYVFELYIYKSGSKIYLLEVIMFMCIMYPALYDLTQLKQ
jgi:hypothetical protein